jgi:hypothetical protein
MQPAEADRDKPRKLLSFAINPKINASTRQFWEVW